MSRVLDRWLPSVTLLIWGGILLYFYFGNRLASLLHANFWPGVLIAGVLLLVLGAVAALGGGAEAGEEDACGQPLTRGPGGKGLTFAVLLIPLLVSFYTRGEGFGLSTIQNRGVIMDANAMNRTPDDLALDGYDVEMEEGNIVLSVVDLLYAAQEPTLRGDFEGKPVQIIGQLMPETGENPRGNRMKVIRMFMSCCAADARPVGALIELAQKPEIPELSWVKVRGIARFPTEGGRTLSVLEVRSIEVTPPPEAAMIQ